MKSPFVILVGMHFEAFGLPTNSVDSADPDQIAIWRNIVVAPYCNQLFLDIISDQAVKEPLALKAPITTAADDIHKYFFIVFLRK